MVWKPIILDIYCVFIENKSELQISFELFVKLNCNKSKSKQYIAFGLSGYNCQLTALPSDRCNILTNISV